MVVCSQLAGCRLSGVYICIIFVYLLNRCTAGISPTSSAGLTPNINLFDNSIVNSHLMLSSSSLTVSSVGA